MDMQRRRFILASAAAAAAATWRGIARGEPTAGTQPASGPAAGADAGKVTDAGPLGDLKDDRVYDDFREQGFFVIRRNRRVFALSSVCTHKGCKVRAQEDGSFLCRCHKSTFDPDGRVTKGPATRDLPRLPVATDERNHLLVKLG